MRHKPSGDLVEVLDMTALANPSKGVVAGRFHAGEEMQDPANFDKAELEFPSGEALPKCWSDVGYRG